MTEEEVKSLTIAYARIEIMFIHFDSFMKIDQPELDGKFLVSRAGVCLFIAHALLYEIITFIRKKGAFPDELQKKYKPLKNHLRKFRNAVFHVPKVFNQEEDWTLINQPDALIKVLELYVDVGHFLKAELVRLDLP